MAITYNENTYRKGLIKQGMRGLLILFFVFLFLELFSRWIAATSLAPFGESMRNDQKMMLRDTVNGGIVAIGDSVIARGFYPELFAALLKQKTTKEYDVYNLGVDGSGLEHHKAYLRYLLNRKVKPDLVIMNVSVHNLNESNFTIDEHHVVQSQYADSNALDYYTRCFVLEKQTIASISYCKAAKYSYFLRLVHFYHQQINNSVQSILHTQKARTINLFSSFPPLSSKGLSAHFGTLNHESAVAPHMLKIMGHEYRDAFINLKFGTGGLDNIVNELNKNSIKVLLVLAPAYQPLMRQIYDKYNLPSNDKISDMLAQYALKKNIAFINLFEAYQNPIYFQDPVHLNIYGAIKMTTALANKITTNQLVAANGYLDQEITQYLKKDKESIV